MMALGQRTNSRRVGNFGRPLEAKTEAEEAVESCQVEEGETRTSSRDNVASCAMIDSESGAIMSNAVDAIRMEPSVIEAERCGRLASRKTEARSKKDDRKPASLYPPRQSAIILSLIAALLVSVEPITRCCYASTLTDFDGK